MNDFQRIKAIIGKKNFKKSKLWKTIELLFPINRSLTGKGNRKTLSIIKKTLLPKLKIKKIKSGSEVYDWKIPFEWIVKDAYIKNKFGEKIIDFKENNLHLLNYSIPFSGIISKKKLMSHLYFLEDQPDLIPYRTSYYKKNWGFCVAAKLISSHKFQGPFEVKINSDFKKNGNLIWGESFKKGKTENEIILSTYCCHPSLANDNLSGLITAIYLFKYIESIETKYSYRLLICPETIGAICFLHKAKFKKILGGMILSCTGGPHKLSIKDSFDKNHWINKMAHKTLKAFTRNNYKTFKFEPDGSDERQYSSPAFRIPTPSIHKSKYYEYKEYHTSGDNLDFISERSIKESLKVHKLWIKNIETFKNRNIFKQITKPEINIKKKPKKICFPKRKQMACEFQLGKIGLYPKLGGAINTKNSSKKKMFKNSIKEKHLKAFNWLMHLADGYNSNYDISKKSKIDIKIINEAIKMFYKKKLIIFR